MQSETRDRHMCSLSFSLWGSAIILKLCLQDGYHQKRPLDFAALDPQAKLKLFTMLACLGCLVSDGKQTKTVSGLSWTCFLTYEAEVLTR